MPRRIAIVGGGVAGLATAYHLVRGGGSVTLFEREALLASHSSARNAAIYTGLSEGAWGALSGRSRELLDDMLGRPKWLRADGFLYVSGDQAALHGQVTLARTAGVPHSLLDRRELESRVPALAGGFAEAGILLPEAGVLDIHRITSHLADGAQAAGAKIVVGREVTAVRAPDGQVRGVELADGSAVDTDAVVLAPGAWASSLGTSCGAPLPLRPLRRHLVQLDPVEPGDEHGPTVWALGDLEVYFRPESGGALASPCDEVPWPPSLPPTDTGALERLADRLAKLAPDLGRASVRRAWACLRTFAPDRIPVIGADPRLEGLYWLSGLGGSGMSMGVAAGELLATLMSGADHPLAATVSPARLLAGLTTPSERLD